MTDCELKAARLQRALGYEFADKALLELALTHRSAGNRNNERLEFLGDSIVNHIIAETLYHKFPSASEGDMSRMRAALVKGDTLAEVARELELGEHLILGAGERKSGGRRRTSILADALEAVTGAILLDSNVETCRGCVLNWFVGRLDTLSLGGADKDAKTSLQEFLQGHGKPLPEYELLGVQGDDHSQQFRVVCRLTKPALTVEGSGSSRRKAEQAAARTALERLNPDEK
ncbi:ribonuclease III [Halioglobus maricola]|uniref:Ribonuclease 3 n=1 Tax=Halioglobus maricola TaxID=2601894 RepID=A0A5P9NMM4_9GAMM|nr:ribonuclease III [Halioglobus maricola]QFU76514.1 ribonuclease III [Halioglobus maricola]